MSAILDVVRLIYQATANLGGRSPDRLAIHTQLYARLNAELNEMDRRGELKHGLIAAQIGQPNILVCGVPVVAETVDQAPRA